MSLLALSYLSYLAHLVPYAVFFRRFSVSVSRSPLEFHQLGKVGQVGQVGRALCFQGLPASYLAFEVGQVGHP